LIFDFLNNDINKCILHEVLTDPVLTPTATRHSLVFNSNNKDNTNIDLAHGYLHPGAKYHKLYVASKMFLMAIRSYLWWLVV